MYPDSQPQVVTGEAVALDVRLAGMGSRGIAALIDYAIITVAQIVLLIVIIKANDHAFFSSNGGGAQDSVLIQLLVAQVGITLGYPVLLETLWRGRTVGKSVMGLQVVRDDGGPIRFRHALVRGLVGVVLEKPGILLTVPALISMSATKTHKRVGDLAAGTVVLQQRVPGRIEAPVDMPPALAGWAASLELSAIDDATALRLRQFLARASALTPATRTALEQQLAHDVTTRVGVPPVGTPPWALFAAVLAERRRRAFSHDAAPPTAAPLQPYAAAAPQPAGPTVTTDHTAPPTEPTEPTPESTTGFVAPS